MVGYRYVSSAPPTVTPFVLEASASRQKPSMRGALWSESALLVLR